ncbi:MAG: sigma 54-interacting transcriptional regulator [Sphingobacteriia bacterium]|nr:sigma 54-interacting transcriptional regulator [Sphingobacteriia bacterium]
MVKSDVIVSLSDAIATLMDKEELFRTIDHQLKSILKYNLGGIILLNRNKNEASFFWTGSDDNETDIGQISEHNNIPLEELWREPFITVGKNLAPSRLDLRHDDRVKNDERLGSVVRRWNIEETINVPMRNQGTIIGFLILGYSRVGFIPDSEFPFLETITNLIAGAVISTLHFEEINYRQRINQLQLDLTNRMIGVINQPNVFQYLAKELSMIIPLDFLNLVVVSPSLFANVEISYVKEADGAFKFVRLPTEIKLTPEEHGLHEFPFGPSDDVIRFTEEEIEMIKQTKEVNGAKISIEEIKSGAYLNLKGNSDAQILLFLASKSASAFSPDDIEVLNTLLPQLRLILENYYAFAEIHDLSKQLQLENISLLKEINDKTESSVIIAESKEMAHVLRRLKQVAGTDSTVLLEGETGVGKEVIAGAIHKQSTHANGPLIKVNCAALPSQLIESELFGHEKGAFTGAIERKIGKFELASKGTIFLDEIGELSLELQSKLLRVIQEKEFERVGGKEIIRSNARLIAATNRNLSQEVSMGRFRADLFFRLNVFPITLPPLRQRRADIPPFINFFVEKYCRRIGKPRMQIDPDDVSLLMNYNWPGNVRELEHTIERAVIISQGAMLDLSSFKPALEQLAGETTALPFKTLEEIEIEHILKALHRTGGKVSGENGAAKLLGLNSKTLDSRMKKLGITKTVHISVKS